eukprot:m.91102 g.91102  ORF g.91102 m.91102 type:complete len:382 (+) comp14615_c0_seq3:253-1398(+)
MSLPRSVPISSWFRALFGAEESSYETVRRQFKVVDHILTAPNGLQFFIGDFNTVSVAELRERVEKVRTLPRRGLGYHPNYISVDYIATEDVMELHSLKENEHALFQAASQMNCLEMVGPTVTPEKGVQRYAHDHTQGPACALVAPAAAVFRNYFATFEKQGVEYEGQTEEHQINTIEGLEAKIGNNDGKYFSITNGYVMSTSPQLQSLKDKLEGDPKLVRELVSDIKIGLHSDVQVTFTGRDHSNFAVQPDGHLVNQVYCSALSIAYNYMIPDETWQPFESIVLDGMYEATILAGILNAERHQYRSGSVNVFLTFVGGGAYGNDMASIVKAMARAIVLHRDFHIKVHVVFFRHVDNHIVKMLETAMAKEAARLYDPNIVDL